MMMQLFLIKEKKIGLNMAPEPVTIRYLRGSTISLRREVAIDSVLDWYPKANKPTTIKKYMGYKAPATHKNPTHEAKTLHVKANILSIEIHGVLKAP